MDTQKLEYLESEISSCSTEDRSENSSNESVILDFLKLNLSDLEPVREPHKFLSESELENKPKKKQETIGNTG